MTECGRGVRPVGQKTVPSEQPAVRLSLPASMVLAASPKKERLATWDRGEPQRVQLRHESQLTAEEYVKQKAWEGASLQQCPLHPEGGCGIARHGTYGRVEPPGMEIARWYCRPGHTTFSLLPDCLAAKLSSTLATVEMVVDAVEQRESSLEATAEKLRADIGVQGAVRWVRRRVVAVTLAMVALKGLRPDVLGGVGATQGEVRAALNVDAVLAAARALAGAQVAYLPPYVGFGARGRGVKTAKRRGQHEAGADPP